MKKPVKLSEAKDGRFNRRDFVRRAALAGVGVAGGSLLLGLPTSAKINSFPALFQHEDEDNDRDDRAADTAQEIFTAALIAEDLATTMYYNCLVGGVIQDPNLAGPGGNLSNPANLANVGYLQGALSEEIVHANLLRNLIAGSNPSSDPVKTFFFPNGMFDNLQNFFPILLALETAFIGAYLTAVQEFSLMAARIEPFERQQHDSTGKPYKREELTFFAKVAASILGVEAEHRTLARAIPSIAPGDTTFGGTDLFPADNVNFEQTDGLKTVYNGAKSAVVALTPFIMPGSGKTGFSFSAAIANASSVSVPTTGGLPD